MGWVSGKKYILSERYWYEMVWHACREQKKKITCIKYIETAPLLNSARPNEIWKNSGGFIAVDKRYVNVRSP